jgi:hypothetical protein
MYSVRIFCTIVLFRFTVVAESPTSNSYGNDLGFSSPSLKGIRYAGPIVYTNEKPPVIHFPPPPPVSTAKNFQGIAKGKSVKYVPMPTHDLPILIYTSDVSPPLHVVSKQQSGSVQPKGNRDHVQGEYSNPRPTFSSQPIKQYSSSKARPKKTESYRTVEPYPEKSTSQSTPRGTQSFYERFPLAQSIKDLLGRSGSSFKAYMSPSAATRTKVPKRKQSYNEDAILGEFSTKNEVVTKPRSSPKQASPLPHIIYTGHAPIHIFNQSPVYVPKSQQVYPKATQDYQVAESEANPSYAPTPSQESSARDTDRNRFTEPQPQADTTYGFTKYTKYSKPYKAPSSSSNSRSTKSGSEYNFSSIHSKTSKPKYGASTGPHPTRTTNRVKSSSSYSHSPTPYTKNRYTSASPKKKTKYQTKVTPTKQYSPAPNIYNKPPIIIYQGLYPPHHVFENQAVDYRVGQPASPAIEQVYGQSIASRMSDNNGVGVPMESSQTQAGLGGEFSGTLPMQPLYYLPQMDMASPAAMYVSDLTSQGTFAQPQFYSVFPTQNAVASQTPQTHTIQIQNPDGTHSTAQVTTISTTADQAANPSVVNEAHIDSIPNFPASSLNNQNNPLVPIPMSLSSIIVQSAGAQHQLLSM